MKLLVLGATGGTGLEVIRLAKERGHAVTALVRNTEKLALFNGRVVVRKGDLLNRAELEAAAQGQDAVLSAFGPLEDKMRVWKQFAAALTEAMSRSGIRRVMVLSVAFLFKDSIIPPAYLAGHLFFRDTVIGAAGMEEIFMKSGLEWTIARPPRLTDGAYTGKYRVREGHLPRFGFTVSRADVADYMIKAVESRADVGKIVGVCN
jgi:putative NADH-flavin reductase